MQERTRIQIFLDKVFANKIPINDLVLIAQYPKISKTYLQEQIAVNYIKQLALMNPETRCCICDSNNISIVQYPEGKCYCEEHLNNNIEKAPFLPLCHICHSPASHFTEQANTFDIVISTPTDVTHSENDVEENFFDLTETTLFACHEHRGKSSRSFALIQHYLNNLLNCLKATQSISDSCQMSYIGVKRIEDLFDLIVSNMKWMGAEKLILKDIESPKSSNFGKYLNGEMEMILHNHKVYKSDYFKKQISTLNSSDIELCPESIDTDLCEQISQKLSKDIELHESLMKTYKNFVTVYNYQSSVNENIVKPAIDLIENQKLDIYESLFILSFFLKNWFMIPSEKFYYVTMQYRESIFSAEDSFQ